MQNTLCHLSILDHQKYIWTTENLRCSRQDLPDTELNRVLRSLGQIESQGEFSKSAQRANSEIGRPP